MVQGITCESNPHARNSSLGVTVAKGGGSADDTLHSEGTAVVGPADEHLLL